MPEVGETLDLISFLCRFATGEKLNQLQKLQSTLQKFNGELSESQSKIYQKVIKFVNQTQLELKDQIDNYQQESKKVSNLAELAAEKSIDQKSFEYTENKVEDIKLVNNIKSVNMEDYILKSEHGRILFKQAKDNKSQILLLNQENEQNQSLIQTLQDENIQLKSQNNDQNAMLVNLQVEHQQNIMTIKENQNTIQNLNTDNIQLAEQLQLTQDHLDELQRQVASYKENITNQQSEQIHVAKINQIFETIFIDIKDIQKTADNIKNSQPSALGLISQKVLEMEQAYLLQNKQTSTTNPIYIIDQQIKNYESLLQNVSKQANHNLQKSQQNTQSDDILQTEVIRICNAFKNQKIVLQRASQNEWVYEKTGIILKMDISERGNICVIQEGGNDIKPVLLSQYLKNALQGVSVVRSSSIGPSTPLRNSKILNTGTPTWRTPVKSQQSFNGVKIGVSMRK